MNPYHRLFDAQNDAAEHASELAAGMAIPYYSDPPPIPADWDRALIVEELRRARREH